MKMLVAALVLVTSSIVAGQRPSYAGTKPIGFPETPNRTTTTPDPLGDRFGEDATERLPIEANGDRDLIDRLSKLPLDKQPFWFINWKAYEQHRKNPQTYPQKPNVFVDPIPVKTNAGQVNSGFSTPSPTPIGTEQTGLLDRFGPATVPNQLNSNVDSGSNSNSNNGVNSNSNFNHNVNLTGNTTSYNTYPTVNPNLNVYTNKNGNSNNYPTGNSNNYPMGNSNNYPMGNSNNYPTGNSNNYPTGNSNNYPTGNSNNYPTGNSNNYPTGNSNLNTQSNSGTVKNNVSNFQTTQKYPLTTFKSTNVGNTNVNNHPEYYPRTDSYPQRSGH